MDYTNFLPDSLEDGYDGLRSVYTFAVTQLDNAYINPVLGGVDMKTPDFPSAKGFVNDAALDAISFARDVISYSSVLSTIIYAIPDTQQLASTLLLTADGWKTLDIDKLRNKNHPYRKVFTSYLPVLDPVVQNLLKLCNDLQDRAPDSPYWTKPLYDTVAPALSPIATFAEGTPGKSTLAGILHLQIDQVSNPLNKLVESGAVELEDVVAAIETHLYSVLHHYQSTVRHMSGYLTSLINFAEDIVKARNSILNRLRQATTSPLNGTSADDCVSAWTGASGAAQAFIDVVSGGKTDRPTVEVPIATPFGDEPDAVELVPKLNEASQNVYSEVEMIGQLPLFEHLRIKTNQKYELSGRHVIVTCKENARILRDLLQGIICDFNGYCEFMKLFEPILRKGVPEGFEDRLNALAKTLRKNSDSAVALSKELLDELTACSEQLRFNISSTKGAPSYNSEDIQNQSYTRSYEILRDVFDVEMVAAFLKDDSLLHSRINTNVATATQKAVKEALTFFQNLNALTNQVSQTWNNLLVPFTGLSSSWALDMNTLQRRCQTYIEHTGDPARRVQYEAAVKSRTLPGDALSHLRSFLSSGDYATLKEGLTPPDIKFTINRATLNNDANEYRYIASLLRSLFPDLASSSDKLAGDITANLIPKLGVVVDFYIEFSKGQENPFDGGLDKRKLLDIVEKRSPQLAKGLTLAEAAETTFLHFNWDSQAAFNDVNLIRTVPYGRLIRDYSSIAG
ncbi:hypothetical protein VNI00_013708 [Paramarasmius palmivorus]|uniref:Uncharacterized protein n=1 Tax=Paramarasmius palmivorus TaxID=297713 RepID=A0AAW0BW08_9AGAR